jgi:hypothetical protein
LQFINVHSVALRDGDDEGDNPDNFYTDLLHSKRRDVRYVLRPFAFGVKEHVDLDEGVKVAYDHYDMHKEQVLQPMDETIGPSSKYDDSLEFRELRELRVEGGEESVKFRNNLTECYGSWLFMAVGSRIIVLKDEALFHTQDTKPFLTLLRHREAAVSPFHPHIINFIKVVHLRSKDMLICCVDDGRTLFYDLTDFKKESLFLPKFQFSMTSSVWGADAQGDIAVISDNSRRVTLVQLGEDIIRVGESVELMHNVPSVKILKVESNMVSVSCVSIAGELIVMEFTGLVNVMPIDMPRSFHPGAVLDFMMSDLPSDPQSLITCSVKYRTQLQEQAWSVNCFTEDDFMEVNDSRYLGVDEGVNTMDILQCSKILGLMDNHLVTSSLGGAATYESIHLRTQFDEEQNRQVDVSGFNSVTDKMSRIKKLYFETPMGPAAPSDGSVLFLIVTTATKVALFRADQLVCNADTGDLFEFGLLEEMEYSNRLSIVRCIPWLSAVVTVSQTGFFTVFRLVKHRGLHSIREEHTWPKLPLDNLSFASITGVGVNRADTGAWLYVSFSDERVRVFELREREGFLEMALL